MGSSSADEKRSEKIQKLKDKLVALRAHVLKCGIRDEQLRETLQCPSQTCKSRLKKETLTKFLQHLVLCVTEPSHRVHVIMLLCALSVALLVGSYELIYDYVRETPCLVGANIISDEAFRPLVDCEMCRTLKGAAVEQNISSETFSEKYAYSGTPVLVKEAIINWTAMSVFSFKYFQNLYRETEGSLATVEEMCQFFPYKTEFLTLGHALNMSDERASFQPGEQPWYIGWSNCHDGVQMELRKHYQQPYFLPPDSESVDVDWIFMGGPGPGAGVHLDYVERPSWQAQILGRKTWQLLPPPECEAICTGFNVTVDKGDIIVVDSNIWYHSTYIHSGEISITIGSEFD